MWIRAIKKPIRGGPGGVRDKTLSIYFVTQRVTENLFIEYSPKYYFWRIVSGRK